MDFGSLSNPSLRRNRESSKSEMSGGLTFIILKDKFGPFLRVHNELLGVIQPLIAELD
jgi:hypothetical protein